MRDSRRALRDLELSPWWLCLSHFQKRALSVQNGGTQSWLEEGPLVERILSFHARMPTVVTFGPLGQSQ